MRRNLIHFTVDALLAACVLVLLATGLLIAVVLPPGARGGGGATVWGWGRHDFGDLHYWVALVMIALATLHVALNWTWVCSVCLKLARRGSKAPSALARNIAGAVGVLLIVAVIGGFLALAAASRVEGERGHERQRGGPWRHNDAPTGAGSPML